ncbi:MAG: uncharacterized protein PWP03_596 [Candidatus Woesearchaeota archaeon]|nr:uncharacterized protein [Candidatus Woesearchaeota archaeon]
MISLEFIPHYKLSGLDAEEKIKLILKSVKQNRIVLIQGRLNREEEAELIKQTMKSINDNFTGIEPAIFYPEIKKEGSILTYLREKLINLFLADRQGLTLIGPASIVKEIRQDLDKLQLYIDLELKKSKSKKSKSSNLSKKSKRK